MSEISKMKTYRDQGYLDWVKGLPCSHCKAPADDAHHIIGVDKMGRMGGKPHDLAVMPLCRECHEAVHKPKSAGYYVPESWPQTRWLVETLAEALREGALEVKI